MLKAENRNLVSSVWLTLGLILLPLLLGFSISTGSIHFSLEEVWNALYGNNTDETQVTIIRELRLTRALGAFAVGASLALSGYLMQMVVTNPLSDPYILGSASGSALGANLAHAGFLPVFLGGWFLPPLWAIAGGLGITYLVLTISGFKKGPLKAASLILTGTALSALCTALSGLITLLSQGEGKLKTMVFWVTGSLDQTHYSQLWVLYPVLFLALYIAWINYPTWILLMLGKERAQLLGLKVDSVQWILIVISVILTALCVWVCGVMGFVGLIIPHLVREVFGFTYRPTLLLVSLTGGLFVLTADWLSRLVYPPTGLPAGLLTALIGIPFFVYLLAQKRFYTG